MKDEAAGTKRYLVADYYDDRKRWWLSVSAGRVTAVQAINTDEARQPQGFVHYVDAHGRQRLVGYYSLDRIASGEAPDYAKSLFIVADGVVYGDAGNAPHLEHRQSPRERVFEVGANGSESTVIEYAWPFYRELLARIFVEPSSFVSKDFISELMRTVRFYRPRWIRSRWVCIPA